MRKSLEVPNSLTFPTPLKGKSRGSKMRNKTKLTMKKHADQPF